MERAEYSEGTLVVIGMWRAAEALGSEDKIRKYGDGVVEGSLVWEVEVFKTRTRGISLRGSLRKGRGGIKYVQAACWTSKVDLWRKAGE